MGTGRRARWAEFARAENHGIGLLFFPAVGLLALLLTTGTAIALRFDRTSGRARPWPAYAAVLVSIVAAIITRGAIVPEMFRVRAANNVAELQQILHSIAPWWSVNDLLHVLAFVFNVWALTEILSRNGAAPSTVRERP